jgi:hypothetical protein
LVIKLKQLLKIEKIMQLLGRDAMD